ncbi:retrovirus-related Pol polyprotein from type-1 retrotransposable element R2 [Nephila pilipes]|uniref:Retrovirus-related Pol polyprotein from type-1 retrotransposable element R2 n=1 Tax=Nephila pilipes TaxID=299642 RepID=A0A8X6TZ89_NEPPI|nr:retrovirus-related Pol polyprotein from type-1 retrotransposable element R2 [Nephila pilipes]GFT73530.1 retrovirus-related Pol polyprotein from type-1 retrotransposable element R2 [Nephila pilipes]GFT84585.1 retrovirus-related Pol polyprotein from type-1 retrotransposable element R2 [Nephila pilipes]
MNSSSPTWVCKTCQFSAISQIALYLHQGAHKKEDLEIDSIKFKSFPTPKERKVRRKKKMLPILQGSPSALLARRPSACSSSSYFSRYSRTCYFSKIWDDCQKHSIPNFGSPPDLPPNIENFITDMVKESLHSAENTAPGPDGIAYKHWREVDPSGVILCKIFILCLHLRQIPDTWKTSLTILIQKKGPTKDLANWWPISLSNTIYKLFTKCLTRKLSDWCSSNNCLSPNQKGFIPFDGVLEHNFIIAQHLESATRRKKDSLSYWLDISNAFGSIHHNILLAALSAIGAYS